MNHSRLISLLFLARIACSATATRLLQDGGNEAPTLAPTIIEYWEPVYGYTDENGNIVEVDVLPPHIAQEQAAPIDSPLATEEEEDVVASAPTLTPTIIEYWDPVYGYTDENGNIVEVDVLPSDIEAEQGAPIEDPLDVEEDEEEGESEIVPDDEDKDATSGPTDNEAIKDETEETIEDSTEFPLIATIVIAFAVGCLLSAGTIYMLSKRCSESSSDDDASADKPGKSHPPEHLEPTESSETGSSDHHDHVDIIESIKPIYNDEESPVEKSSHGELATAIENMRRIEQQELEIHADEDGMFTI